MPLSRFKKPSQPQSSSNAKPDGILRKTEGGFIFLKQLVKNPKSLKALGTLVPSSEALGRFISKQLNKDTSGYILEIGAGTGALTQEILKAGISPQQLIVVELDPDLVKFLKASLPPEVMIIQGNAAFLERLLPPQILGNVKNVISGIPMMNLHLLEKIAIVRACFSVMQPQGSLLQFTYGPRSPLPVKRLGLEKERVGHVLFNFPPATVWQYKRRNKA